MPALLLTCLALLLAGCTGSRWAKQDPDYAAKYPRHTDNVGRTIKQAVDARHLRQKSGAYGWLGARDEPTAMGAELGLFRYPNPWLEGRVGLAGLIYENDDIPMSGGAVAAARLQTPTRLAPFIGLGGYAGMTPEVGATNDGIDNDGDLFIDESDETDQGFVFALIPETGIHFWLTPGWRITASASYYMPSSGREDDFWMYGISLSCLTDLGIATNPKTLRKQAHERGWQIGDGHTPQHLATSYHAPSEPLELPQAAPHLSEATTVLLPGDRDDRQTVYDSLPAASP